MQAASARIVGFWDFMGYHGTVWGRAAIEQVANGIKNTRLQGLGDSLASCGLWRDDFFISLNAR
jgi:hypothetical protein